jgi:hypothetical protein
VFKKRQPAFRRVAASLFGLVALAHAARLIWDIPIRIDEVAVPNYASWIGLVLAGILCLWGFGSRS